MILMGNKISKGRKITYYAGLGLIIIGGLLFFSSFLTPFIGFNESAFDMGMPSMMKNAPIGMFCMIVGGVLMNIGASGAAGSGLILDPDKAREDLKPHNTAKGKMINDVASQVDVLRDVGNNIAGKEPSQLIKIRCRKCETLNDEDAVFCKACGDKV